MLEVVNFTGLLQLATSCAQQSYQFHQVATRLLKSGLLQFFINLQTCYKLAACW